MDQSAHFDVELPEDLAEAVRARVESGAYASVSEVIQEGLRLLAEQEEPLEDWVRAELAAGYDAWKADPSKVYTIEEVRERLDEQRRRRA